MNAMTILSTLDRHAARLKKYGIVEIGLFGSWGHGKPRRSSDIDILVEFSPSMTTFDNFMDTKFFLEKILRKKVDLVIKSAIKPALRQRILESTRYVALN